MMDENNRSTGWELQKENIQPLLSGRKVGLLKHNLETSMKNMADYEAEIEIEVKKLEGLCETNKETEDPLEHWLTLITFLENSCLQVAKLKIKLRSVLKECTIIFLKRRRYKNDKRFVEVYIKSLEELEPSKRINIFHAAMLSGLGVTCSALYLTIAELEEGIGKVHNAVKTLKLGLEQKSHPIEQIKDALSELEYRVAQRLAESFVQNAAAVSDSRKFASSVPVYGIKNEAPAFRTDLQSAVPVSQNRHVSNSKRGLQQIEIFPSGNDEERTNPNPVDRSSMLKAEAVEHDDENKLRPSKWNKREVAFETESNGGYVETPRERIQYPCEETSGKVSSSAPIQGGVLRERKEVGLELEVQSGVAGKKLVPSWYKPPTKDDLVENERADSIKSVGPIKLMFNRIFHSDSPDDIVVSFEHRRRDAGIRMETKKLDDVQRLTRELESAKNELLYKGQQLQNIMTAHKEESVHWKSMISEYQTSTDQLKKQTNMLEVKGKELSILLLQAKSRNVELVNFLSQEKARNTELGNSLNQEKHTIAELTKSLSEVKIRNEKLTESLSQMTARNQELSAALLSQQSQQEQQCGTSSSSSGPSSAECTFLPRSSNHTIRGGIMEESLNSEQSKEIDSISRSEIAEIEFMPPPPMATKKAAFTLYESHVGSFSSFAGVFHGNGSSRQNRMPTSNFNKENQIQNNIDFRQLSENIPPTANPSDINMDNPSFRTEPLVSEESTDGDFARPLNSQTPGNPARCEASFIYTENLDDSEVIEREQGRSSPDFNLSNLTRALAFLPEPLLNSTPERVPPGYNHQFDNLNNVGNYVHTQRIQPINIAARIMNSENRENFVVEGPLSPEARAYARMINQSSSVVGAPNNLSPIQETSKEHRSNCTSGSSSGSNMTSTRGATSSGTSLYNSTQSTRSGGPKSISRYQNFH